MPRGKQTPPQKVDDLIVEAVESGSITDAAEKVSQPIKESIKDYLVHSIRYEKEQLLKEQS